MGTDCRRERLREAFVRAAGEKRCRPVTEEELAALEGRAGPIPEPYRWFLRACGGGPAGPDWLDGVEDLARSRQRFRRASEAGRGWNLERAFLVGWDAAGNPLGLDVETGALRSEECGLGCMVEVANSLEDFLEMNLSSGGSL